MRFFVLALALSVTAASAVAPAGAQTAPLPAPYRFGMTQDEARAVDPEIQAPSSPMALRSRRELSIGGFTFRPRLYFRGEGLSRVVYGAVGRVSQGGQCAAAHARVIAALEQDIGPFNGGPGANEYGAALYTRSTAADSQSRAYLLDGSDVLFVTANRNAPGASSVNARFGPYPSATGERADACEITIEMRPSPAPVYTRLTPPTAQQLAAADVVDVREWEARHTGDDTEQTLPERADQAAPVQMQVDLDCLVIEAGALNCAIARESPSGQHYGEAALRLSQRYRAPLQVNGASTLGARVSLPIRVGLNTAVYGPRGPAPDPAALEALAAAQPSRAELDAAPLLASPITWLERPTAQSFDRYYPQGAMDRNLQGRIVLECLIAPDGRLRCAVTEETPPGEGFGVAGLGVAQDFRIAPQMGGAPTAGRRVRIPISFQLSTQ
jgi:TonB family protein